MKECFKSLNWSLVVYTVNIVSDVVKACAMILAMYILKSQSDTLRLLYDYKVIDFNVSFGLMMCGMEIALMLYTATAALLCIEARGEKSRNFYSWWKGLALFNVICSFLALLWNVKEESQVSVFSSLAFRDFKEPLFALLRVSAVVIIVTNAINAACSLWWVCLNATYHFENRSRRTIAK